MLTENAYISILQIYRQYLASGDFHIKFYTRSNLILHPQTTTTGCREDTGGKGIFHFTITPKCCLMLFTAYTPFNVPGYTCIINYLLHLNCID